jgi:hypothetical protein
MIAELVLGVPRYTAAVRTPVSGNPDDLHKKGHTVTTYER